MRLGSSRTPAPSEDRRRSVRAARSSASSRAPRDVVDAPVPSGLDAAIPPRHRRARR